MSKAIIVYKEYDHCRIGSLEKNLVGDDEAVTDHCRIGSLEITIYFRM